MQTPNKRQLRPRNTSLNYGSLPESRPPPSWLITGFETKKGVVPPPPPVRKHKTGSKRKVSEGKRKSSSKKKINKRIPIKEEIMVEDEQEKKEEEEEEEEEELGEKAVKEEVMVLSSIVAPEEPEIEFEAPDECFEVKHAILPQESITPDFQGAQVMPSPLVQEAETPLPLSSQFPMSSPLPLSSQFPMSSPLPQSSQFPMSSPLPQSPQFPISSPLPQSPQFPISSPLPLISTPLPLPPPSLPLPLPEASIAPFQEQSTEIIGSINTFPVVIKTEPEQEITMPSSPLPDFTSKPLAKVKTTKKYNRRTQTTASFTKDVTTQTCSDDMEPDYELEFAKTQYEILLKKYELLKDRSESSIQENEDEHFMKTIDAIDSIRDCINQDKEIIQEQNEIIKKLKEQVAAIGVKDGNGEEEDMKIESKTELEKNEPVAQEAQDAQEETNDPATNFTYQKAEEYFTGVGGPASGGIGGSGSGGSGSGMGSSKKTLITIKLPIMFVAKMQKMGFVFTTSSDKLVSFTHQENGFKFCLRLYSEAEKKTSISYEFGSSGSMDKNLPEYLKENIVFDKQHLSHILQSLSEILT